MKFQLHHVGLAALLGGVLLSGIVSNVFSALCVAMAVVCWFAGARLREGGFALGLLAALGWLLIAALWSSLMDRQR